jgi:hypothetical protein
MTTSLEHLSVEAFAPRVGDRFRISPAPDRALDAELIEARALGAVTDQPASGSARRTPFSLLFRTALAAPLPQRIYAVEHAEMGVYEIFLVPVGPDAGGMVYEAIFT